MEQKPEPGKKPEILAPAGNRDAFLSAIAAGADAVYCGLKSYSARMGAKNFSMSELIPLVHLARDRGVRVYIALNTLMKSEDLLSAGKMIDQLEQFVKPDALICQDPAIVQLARQTDFSGQIHLSTLANVSFPGAFQWIRKHLKVDRVVIPRELDIEEIKSMSDQCPQGIGLEVFVHGALCYGVSGRCYWSSYLGGKSGLRGRCVQPCRRFYSQKSGRGRFFSCNDLSLDVLVKVLLNVRGIRAWKIEGRKKGPHYVFYTVKAYQTLRDYGKTDPQAKRDAVGLLEQALGRPGSHYNFIPHRRINPVAEQGKTGSGRLIGMVKGPKQSPYLVVRDEVQPVDVLRFGFEGDPGYHILKIKRFIPKSGRLHLQPLFRRLPLKGTPVFLIDRREKALEKMIQELSCRLDMSKQMTIKPSGFNLKSNPQNRSFFKGGDMVVSRYIRKRKSREIEAVWVRSMDTSLKLPKKRLSNLWFWLPPVIWPSDQRQWDISILKLLEEGARSFVLNASWQMSFFSKTDKINLWAGPFCNLANPLSISWAEKAGFNGVIVNPELSRDDYQKLPGQSPLPLGIVVSGNWPLCISRIASPHVIPGEPIFSPKKEGMWTVQQGADTWVYPNWPVDLTSERKMLEQMGYSIFVQLIEPVPKNVVMKKRPGKWNWDIGLS